MLQNIKKPNKKPDPKFKKIINARCGRHKNKEYTHGCLFVCARKKKAERAIDYTAV